MKLFTKIKDRILRHTILVRSRKMFYIKDCQVIEPDIRYKNMTHREWFSKIGLDISDKFLLRGYYRNGLIMLYTGLNHDIEYFPCAEVIISIYKYFSERKYSVEKMHIGSIHSIWRTFIGKDWKPKYVLNIDNVRDTYLYNSNYKKLILFFNKSKQMLEFRHI